MRRERTVQADSARQFCNAADGVSDVAERNHQVLVVGIRIFEHDIQIGRDGLGRFQVITGLMFSYGHFASSESYPIFTVRCPFPARNTAVAISKAAIPSSPVTKGCPPLAKHLTTCLACSANMSLSG